MNGKVVMDCIDAAYASVKEHAGEITVLDQQIGDGDHIFNLIRGLEALRAMRAEIEGALEHPVDFKSALQELLARRGAEVSYEVTSEGGPPHERVYEVTALVDGRELGSGSGRSKKHAEQEAAREAFDTLETGPRA